MHGGRWMTLLATVLTAAAGMSTGAEWRRTADGVETDAGTHTVVLAGDGTIRAGGAGDAGTVTLAFFRWHDEWVYQRLDAGMPDGPPVLRPDGTALLAGTWGTSDGVPPLRYELEATAREGTVAVRLRVRKTGPLKLTNGIWAVVSVPLPAEGSEAEVYARPAAHAPAGTNVSATCEALLIGPKGGPAVAIGGPGFRSVRSRIGETWHAVEMMLRGSDFPEGETAEFELTIGSETMPSRFPGEIVPDRSPLALNGIGGFPDAPVPIFGKLEFTADLRATWDNPFDPEDVSLDAIVHAPSRTYRLPGFFTVDHDRLVRDGAEAMVPKGSGRWCVRLTPDEPGTYTCELIARDRTGTVSLKTESFRAVAGPGKGFIRQSKADPRYLAFDNGKGYMPIGHNLPIYHSTGQTAEQALRRMAAAGENYNRWWMSSSGLGIEWEPTLGRYRQAAAARLDYALELAGELGMAYMLCMDTHQDFREQGWIANPFNQRNGGPCATAGDWFTNAEARRLYRNRLRYTVARWGFSPEVLAWEFGNEFEGWADSPDDAKLAWHREMADALARLDPYGHLITTSWWSKTGPEAFWQIPRVGIVQTHCYTNNDRNVAEEISEYCRHQWSRFEKPHIFGEFGIRSHSTTADKDPQGRALHNAFWSAVATGCCGVPMPWWHENYIDPLDLYHHFTAIRRFTDRLPFGEAPARPLEVSDIRYAPPVPPPVRDDLRLEPRSGFRKAAVAEFTVRPDGTVNDPGEILELLHGKGHADLKNPPTFVVTYPEPGLFSVRVGRVSKSGTLRVTVDGKAVLERHYPCGPDHGKESVERPEWNLWESLYDEDVHIPIPAGLHRIRVENDGEDWMRIGHYTFAGCRVTDRPNLMAAGMLVGDRAFVWIQNRDSSWVNHAAGTVRPVAPSRVEVNGLTDGPYRAEWYDTATGMPVREENLRAQGGRVVLAVAELVTDTAAILHPME